MLIWDSLGKIGEKITGSIEKAIPDKDLAAQLKNEIQNHVVDAAAEITKSQAQVLSKELEGNFLQRSWRPILMMILTFILFWNFFLCDVFGFTRSSLPPELWSLLDVGVGGYIGLRSIEKIIGDLKRK